MNDRRSTRAPWGVFVAVLLAAITLARPAEATTFTVTNANDSGSGSLRAAIDLANADVTATSGSPHSIDFSGTIGVIRLASNLPFITNHMTIDGGTLNSVIVDGVGAYRGFFIDTGTVTLRNLVIYNTRAKGGDGGGGTATVGSNVFGGSGGGGAGLGAAVFVNQATAAVTLDTVAISTSNVTGGAGAAPGTTFAAGGGGGMAFNGGGGSVNSVGSGTNGGGAGGGGGLLGVGADGDRTIDSGGAGGAGGGGGGGGLPYGGAAGSQVTTNAAPQRGLNQGEGVYVNGAPPAAGGAGGFGGGGGGGVVETIICCVGPAPGAYTAGGGAGGFGGGGGGAPLWSGVGGGAGGFGGGGGGGYPGGTGGTGGGRGGGLADNPNTNTSGGGGAAFGPAAFVNLGTLVVINSTVLNLSATAGFAESGSGAETGTADATAIYNRAGTVTGSFASGTPQTGYWWYAVESGRGYAAEIAGGRLFMSLYFYAGDGTAKWWVVTGAMIDDAHFWGLVLEAAGGQQLDGAYQPASFTHPANVLIAFTGPTTATMSWADGTIPISRFDIVGGGVAAGPAAGSPEKGWYWNADENGRGWFVEVQGSTLFLSGFMYDARGQPTWYTSQGAMTTTSLYSGTLLLFADGKSIGGPNQSPGPGTSQGTVTLQFPTTTTAILTLPGGGTVNLVRFTF